MWVCVCVDEPNCNWFSVIIIYWLVLCDGYSFVCWISIRLAQAALNECNLCMLRKWNEVEAHKTTNSSTRNVQHKAGSCQLASELLLVIRLYRSISAVRKKSNPRSDNNNSNNRRKMTTNQQQRTRKYEIVIKLFESHFISQCNTTKLKVAVQ